MTVRIWNVETGETVRQFAVAKGPVRAVAWDPSGQHLAWGIDSSVFISDWGKVDTAPVELGDGPIQITTLDWSPDSQRLAATCWWQTQFAVWDVESAEIVKPPFECTLIKWAEDGHSIEGWLVCKLDGQIEYYKSDYLLPVQQFIGHTSPVRFPQWSADGKSFLTASEDRTARIWDLESGTLLRSFQGHSSTVLTARFNQAGTDVASVSEDGTTKIWPVQSPCRSVLNNSIGEVSGGLQKKVTYVSWAPDGQRLCASSFDGLLRIWDLRTQAAYYSTSVVSATNACWSHQEIN